MNLWKTLAAVTAAAAIAVPVSAAEQPHPFAGDRQVTVMTGNLYLGTDLNPILTSLPALLVAVGAGWAQVQANDFPARARALTDEIADSRPDLVDRPRRLRGPDRGRVRGRLARGGR